MAAPDGAPEVAAPESGSRLPVAALEPLICRAFFSASVFGYVWSDSPGRLQEPPMRGGSQSRPRLVAPGI